MTKLKVPKQVDSKLIHSNGRLISNSELRSAKKYFRKNPGVNKLSRRAGNYSHSIIMADENKLFAISPYCLGEGGNGKVKLVQDLQTKKWFVVKIGAFIQSYRNPIDAERSNLKLFGSYRAKLDRTKYITQNIQGSVHTFDRIAYTIANIIPGVELFQELFSVNAHACHKKDLTPDQKLEMSKAVLKSYDTDFYQKGYIHRDLKPENIMYDTHNKTAKIIDLASVYKDTGNVFTDVQLYGTPGYYAPEVSLKQYSIHTDSYALGRTLFDIVSNEYFNQAINPAQGYYDPTQYSPVELLTIAVARNMMCPKPEDRILPFVALKLLDLPKNDLLKMYSEEQKVQIIQFITEGLDLAYNRTVSPKLVLNNEEAMKLSCAKLLIDHITKTKELNDKVAKSLFAKIIYYLSFKQVKFVGFRSNLRKNLKKDKNELQQQFSKRVAPSA